MCFPDWYLTFVGRIAEDIESFVAYFVPWTLLIESLFDLDIPSANGTDMWMRGLDPKMSCALIQISVSLSQQLWSYCWVTMSAAGGQLLWVSSQPNRCMDEYWRTIYFDRSNSTFHCLTILHRTQSTKMKLIRSIQLSCQKLIFLFRIRCLCCREVLLPLWRRTNHKC